MSRRRKPHDTRHHYPLDALLDDETFADRIWTDLHVLSMRRRLSQPLDELRLAAWKSLCAIETQRHAVERAYGL